MRAWFCLFLVTEAFAQLVVPGAGREAAGTLSIFLGAGGRAEAMGGAFTAVAGDPTAASANPAGLAAISDPEISITHDRLVIALLAGPVTMTGPGFHQTLEAESSGDYSHIGFAAITVPIPRYGVVTQLTYRKLSTFPELDTVISGTSRAHARLIPAGDIYDFAISLARQAGPLSLGLSVNYLVSDAEVHFILDENGPTIQDRHRFEFSDLYADFGMLLRVSDRISIGAVYHGGFETEVRGQIGEDPFSSELTWPSGYAVGVAWRPADPLLLAADYTVMKWSNAKIQNLGPFPSIFAASQRDETSVRFGGEYSFLIDGELRIPVRAGTFLNQRPGSMYGREGVAPRYTGWSLGGGVAFDKIRIDLGYVRTSAKETAAAAIDAGVELPSRSSRVTTERLLLSLAVSF